MNSVQDQVIAARLSIQRALLGEVFPNLRAVVFSITDRDIDIRFYIDGFISEDDAESASRVETEIIADYEVEDTVIVRCIRLDAPRLIDDSGVWVFQRHESSDD